MFGGGEGELVLASSQVGYQTDCFNLDTNNSKIKVGYVY
jgi:hypothetical protein